MVKKNTKIVCTLGPSSDSVKEITALIRAGMNVARLNFSHGTYEDHSKIIKNLHKAEKITGKRIGLMQDLQGPKIRLGVLPKEGIQLKRGDIIELTTKKIIGSKGKKILIPIQYKNFLRDVKIDDTILIQDGMIEVQALKINKSSAICEVKFGGLIKSRNGINLPDSEVSSETITDKDRKDLKFGLKNKVDFVALSFVKDANDIKNLRKLIQKNKGTAQIIAKIERHEALQNLTEIINAADGIMVARGDLGADTPPEQVPLVQKKIIALANEHSKPVITATEVLQSMITQPRATRAEISDAANAIFDGTDALMLSNESAIGKYPSKAAATLAKVARAMEKALNKPACTHACQIAQEVKAKYIVTYTEKGQSARNIAECRSETPIITLTDKEKTAQELTLSWGLNTIFIQKFKQNSKLPDEIFHYLKKKKIIKKFDQVVIVCQTGKKESIISTYKY